MKEYFDELSLRVQDMEGQIKMAENVIEFMKEIKEPVSDLEATLNDLKVKMALYKTALEKRKDVQWEELPDLPPVK